MKMVLMNEHRNRCRLLKLPPFQGLRGIQSREMHRLIHNFVKNFGIFPHAS